MAAKGDRSRVCGLGMKVVEADVSIHHLSVVLTDESAAMTSFGEKMALVVVGETSPKENNFMRQLECGV